MVKGGLKSVILIIEKSCVINEASLLTMKRTCHRFCCFPARLMELKNHSFQGLVRLFILSVCFVSPPPLLS